MGPDSIRIFQRDEEIAIGAVGITGTKIEETIGDRAVTVERLPMMAAQSTAAVGNKG